MNLQIDPALDMDPQTINRAGGTQTVRVTYAIGAKTPTQACDRILVNGVEQSEKECFSVTNTPIFPHPETRHVTVTPKAGVDFIPIEVLAHEVNDSNPTVDAREVSASGVVSIL